MILRALAVRLLQLSNCATVQLSPADLQVVVEGSDVVFASARLVGRETLPVSTAETLPSTPALERLRDSQNASSPGIPTPPIHAASAASLELPAGTRASRQLPDAETSFQLISRGCKEPNPGSGEAAHVLGHPAGCGCESPSSDERAFIISTAEADWGVSIGTWEASTASLDGGGGGQLHVRLHRMDDAKGTCTDMWLHETRKVDEVGRAAPIPPRSLQNAHMRYRTHLKREQYFEVPYHCAECCAP